MATKTTAVVGTLAEYYGDSAKIEVTSDGITENCLVDRGTPNFAFLESAHERGRQIHVTVELIESPGLLAQNHLRITRIDYLHSYGP